MLRPAMLVATLGAAAIAAASAMDVPVDARAIILDTVTVRVYDGVGVTPSDRNAALQAAALILSRAELEVAWIVCTPARDSRTARACDAPPAAHELVVRLTNSTPTAEDGNRRAFGYSLLDAATGSGALSTVFVDRVDWLASTGKAVRADVLGRAIAHELGHLMLGSNNHTARGLMRETWTAEELMRNRSEDWQFSSAQRSSMRARWARSEGPARRASREPRSSSGANN